MVVEQLSPPREVAEAFIGIAHRIVWCTMATVDRRGRPRSRVVHPVWAFDGDDLVGWVTSRPTALRTKHLQSTPFVSCSYWDDAHDVAVAECGAQWVTDTDEKQRAWEICRALPAPAGHDPAAIWPAGPSDPDAGVIKLTPWRLKATRAREMATRAPGLVWRAAG